MPGAELQGRGLEYEWAKGVNRPAALPSRGERKHRRRGRRRSGALRFISLLLAVALAGAAVLTVLSLEVLSYIRESPYQYWGLGGAGALVALWLVATLAAGRSAARSRGGASAREPLETRRPVRPARPEPGGRTATGAGPRRVPPPATGTESADLENSLSLTRERMAELRRAIGDAFPDLIADGAKSSDGGQHSS